MEEQDGVLGHIYNLYDKWLYLICMDLRNKILTIKGKQLYILAGKPTAIPNRTLYLLNAVDGEADYSLWLVEPDEDDEEKIHMWPYKGPDTERLKLIMELSEDFLEHAFDK
jgi:hypothetical protein